MRLGLVAGVTLAGVGAGLGAATATASSVFVRAAFGAAGGLAGLVGATITDRILQRKDERASAVRLRNEVLAPVTTILDGAGGDFEVLLATGQVAPFRGRNAELERLGSWLRDSSAPLVAVVTGSAGTGKTRLVTEFAVQMFGSWFAGWLEPGRGPQ